jgi:hypothetical protein
LLEHRKFSQTVENLLRRLLVLTDLLQQAKYESVIENLREQLMNTQIHNLIRLIQSAHAFS